MDLRLMTIILILLVLPLQFALGAGRLVCVSDHHVSYSCHESDSSFGRVSDHLREPDVGSDTECGNCMDLPIGDSPAMPLPVALQGFQLHWVEAQFWFGVLDPPQVFIPFRYAGRGKSSPFGARAFALTISPRC